ncbi:MAG: hypothetical protein PUA93_07660, partial [Eubacteriales bacterium]|nr:hypothetical protein [Eubacteriales bacterium]
GKTAEKVGKPLLLAPNRLKHGHPCMENRISMPGACFIYPIRTLQLPYYSSTLLRDRIDK